MTIAEQIITLRQCVAEVACQCGRNPNDITVLAVSKGHSANSIQEAFLAGIHHFGESYWQEAKVKMAQLASLPIQWHFIGKLQRNKAPQITQHFHWVHSLTRLEIAEILSEHRSPELPNLNVCIQVNIDEEATKEGLTAAAVIPFAKKIQQLPKLQLRGLMVIPKPSTTPARQYQTFLKVTALFQQLQTAGFFIDTLSMGMSEDWEAAIKAGSTLIRIGRRIFGERIKHDV